MSQTIPTLLASGRKYTPKAVRGISYPGFTRINKTQLARLFADDPNFRFSGFLVGNNVNASHFFRGWHLACTLEDKTHEEMKESLNSFAHYLDAELGSAAAIFLEHVKPISRASIYNNDNH